jgi:hypothetical protein
MMASLVRWWNCGAVGRVSVTASLDRLEALLQALQHVHFQRARISLRM